jgi:cell wall-associated NlpC family hydrolase
MNVVRYLFAGLFLAFILSSCASGHSTRSVKYARADKRIKYQPVKRERDYIAEKKDKSEERNESKTVRSDMQLRDEIVLKALNLTGREYSPGGKNPDTGFDCSGFTSYVFRLHGIQLGASSDQQAKQGLPKSKHELTPGDLVFFGNQDRISHVGIVASNKNNDLEIIHSTTSAGVKIDNIARSDYWQSRFLFGRDVISEKKDFQ